MPDDATSYSIADDQTTLPNARKAVGGRDSSSLVSFLAGSLGRLEGASARAEKSAQEADTMKPPELHEPVQPPEQQTDPIMSFGQPAVWLAAFGSLLTRQPLTTAINAAASAMQATKGQDFEIAKHNMDVWRTQSENAIKLAKFQQDAYKSVIDKAGKDANVASALARTTGAAFKDAPALMVLETEGLEGFKRFIKTRGKQTAAMESGSADFTKHVDAQTKIVQGLNSDDPNKQADALDLYATQLDSAAKGKGSTATSRMGVMSVGVRLKGIADKLRSGDPAQIAAAQQEASSIPDIGPGVLKPPPKAQQTQGTLTDDAAKMTAEQYLLTGQMPALGFGASARVQVLNKASELAKEQGHTMEDYISGRAAWKADTSSLTQITKISDAVEGFERTAISNMELARKLMDKGAGSSAGPVVNRWLQAGKVATGDPDVAAFNTAMGVAASEYGKVISGGSASIAATPEGARAEAQEWLNKIQSPEALEAQFKVARQDMENRRTSLFQQRDLIKDRLKGGTKNDSSGSHPDNDPDGTVRSQGGVKYRKTNGQWLPVAGTE